MKTTAIVSLLLLVFVSTLLSTGACASQKDPRDIAIYSLDQVIEVAIERSPDCRLKVPGKVKGWCVDPATQYEKAEPIFAAKFIGDRTWIVAKVCPVNPQWNRLWYFYEDTGELMSK